jgi:DsbC/DsbD-like thiol-disulfide interchange protein
MILHNMKPISYFASIALAVALLPSITPTRANSAPPIPVSTASTAVPTAPIPHGSVTLVAEKPVVDPHGDLWLALHFTLEPGWHTYWVNPGDSGEAPRLVWHLPNGLTAGAIGWPAPKRLQPGAGIMDFGFTDDAVLLVPVRPTGGLKTGTTANLGVEIRLVVCREVCVPGKAQVSLDLPIGAELAGVTARPQPQVANLFASARSHLPKPSPAQWKVRAAQTKDDFTLDVDAGHSISHAVFFPIDEDQIANAAPQPVESSAKGFRMRLHKSDQLKTPIERLRGVLVLDNGAYSVDAPIS